MASSSPSPVSYGPTWPEPGWPRTSRRSRARSPETAEDVLRRNPRFLTRAKNFPTFLSAGPHLVPLAEVRSALPRIEVQTVHNGSVHCRNTVSNMTFSPEFLVSFHSKVMPLFPGDIIATGTPGAVVITAGDVVECRIPGIGSLRNPVVSGEGGH